MITLKYKVIKSKKQYFHYCSVLNDLVSRKLKSQRFKDEIELLTVLIEKWDRDHNKFENADPIALIRFLLQQHNMAAQDLVKVLGVSKGLVSDILNYKKGLSKKTIQKLAAHFKMDQAAFNRPYLTNEAQPKKSTKKIKPILYHSFEEKKKLESKLFQSMPKEKRERLSKELMSIFNTKQSKGTGNSKSSNRANKKS